MNHETIDGALELRYTKACKELPGGRSRKRAASFCTQKRGR